MKCETKIKSPEAEASHIFIWFSSVKFNNKLSDNVAGTSQIAQSGYPLLCPYQLLTQIIYVSLLSDRVFPNFTNASSVFLFIP